MKYQCNCGEILRPVKIKNKTGTRAIVSYKLLIVEKRTYYKCPLGHEQITPIKVIK